MRVGRGLWYCQDLIGINQFVAVFVVVVVVSHRRTEVLNGRVKGLLWKGIIYYKVPT